jgi:hypothetical protein
VFGVVDPEELLTQALPFQDWLVKVAATNDKYA